MQVTIICLSKKVLYSFTDYVFIYLKFLLKPDVYCTVQCDLESQLVGKKSPVIDTLLFLLMQIARLSKHLFSKQTDSRFKAVVVLPRFNFTNLLNHPNSASKWPRQRPVVDHTPTIYKLIAFNIKYHLFYHKCIIIMHTLNNKKRVTRVSSVKKFYNSALV